MSALATTYKFTTNEYYRLYSAGVLADADRIELLNGELIIMHAIGYRHAQAVTNLTYDFGEQARRRYMLSPQNPVELDKYSAPQPDIVLVPLSRRQARQHPQPEEVSLIIEVADSSLGYDRLEKMRAYAAVGIREYWVFNLEADVLEIFRQPEADGYRDQSIVPIGGSASPLAFPDVVIVVADILPPR